MDNGEVTPLLSEIGKEIDFGPYESTLPNFTNRLFDAMFTERPVDLPLVDLNRV